jgi:tetratricopeptide (TPR) repeat protein
MKGFLVFVAFSIPLVAASSPQDKNAAGDSDVIRTIDSRAATLVQAGNFADAERFYQQTLELRGSGSVEEHSRVIPAVHGFLSMLSAGYLGDAQLEAESRKFKQTIVTSKLSRKLYAIMFEQFMRAQLTVEAESVLQSAVEAFPESRQVRYDLAEIYVTLGKHERALAAFKEALESTGNPDPAEDRRQRSIIYQRIGVVNKTLLRFDDALSAFKTALELGPNIEATVALGDLYLWLDQLNSAAEEFARAAAARPPNVDALSGLAEVNLRLGRFPESAAAAAKVVEMDPQRPRDRYVLAMALIRSDRPQDGRNALNEYLKLQSDLMAEENRLQAIWDVNRRVTSKLREGQFEEAAALLREGIRLHPETRGLSLRLGLIRSKQGRHQEAAELFESLINSGSRDPVLHWILATEYETLGDSRARQYRVMCLQQLNAALKAEAGLLEPRIF